MGRLILLLLAICPGDIFCQDIVAVLSSESGYYREALAGFENNFDRNIPIINLQISEPRLTQITKAVVAFGAKAALRSYPNQTLRVVCLAPGLAAVQGTPGEKFIHIQMMPPPRLLLSKIKEIQPSLKKLAVFWISDSMTSYVGKIQLISSDLGIEIAPQKLGSIDHLPRHLREVLGNAEAFWLAPDPALVNAQSFTTVKDFSWSNKIPFYAPTSGLAEKGAIASVSVSLREVGRAAAGIVQEILRGAKVNAQEFYPEKTEVVINMTAAASLGLSIPVEAIQKADKVIP